MTDSTQRWKYIDPSGEVQGPFTTLEIETWYHQGWFQDELLISLFDQNEFITMKYYFDKKSQQQTISPPLPPSFQPTQVAAYNDIQNTMNNNNVKSNKDMKLTKKKSIFKTDEKKRVGKCKEDSFENDLMESLNTLSNLSLSDVSSSSSSSQQKITKDDVSSSAIKGDMQSYKTSKQIASISKKNLIKNAEKSKATWNEFKSNNEGNKNEKKLNSSITASELHIHDNDDVSNSNTKSTTTKFAFTLNNKTALKNNRKSSKAMNVIKQPINFPSSSISSSSAVNDTSNNLISTTTTNQDDRRRMKGGNNNRRKYTRMLVVDTSALVEDLTSNSNNSCNVSPFEVLLSKNYITTSLVMVLSPQVLPYLFIITVLLSLHFFQK